MLETSEAAEDRNADPRIDDAAETRNRLQERAARRGYTLRASGRGYVLLKGIHSWHSDSLDTIGTLLARLERGR
jgi:hypothetical protein